MSTKLHISDKLALPVDAVTQTFAILGIRGSGKTNTAVDLAEELLAARQQVVILDPVDVWFGLRSSANGKDSGYQITILGGEHGDLPLDAAAGATLADFVVDHGASIVISLRHLSMSDQRRFAADFATRLYERKGETKSRSPLHLIVDECDEFVPQRIPPGGERMFGAFDRIVRRGRAAGIGVTLISQRAQVVNKDVLSQIETLICHRVLHKLDRKALEAWIEAHDVDSQGDAFMASLASLERGDAWVWSPEWLGIFQRVHMRARKTFDSSATPKAGEKRQEPKQLAAVDLDELRKRLAATIEKAKAEDPKELQRQIADRDRRIRELEKAKPVAAPPVDTAAIVEQVTEQVTARAHDFYAKRSNLVISALQKAIEQLSSNGFVSPAVRISPTAPSRPAGHSVVAAAERPIKPARTSSSGPGEKLPKAERAILSVLAQFGSRTKVQIAILCGYSHKGGGFNNALSALRSAGYISDAGVGIEATSEGLDALGNYDPLPTGRDLLDYWLRREGKAERSILEALSERQALSKAELAEVCGYSESGGGFNNALSRLRTLELINGSKEIAIAKELL